MSTVRSEKNVICRMTEGAYHFVALEKCTVARCMISVILMLRTVAQILALCAIIAQAVLC